MDKIVHFEVPFDDEERAKSFYNKIFGWKIIPMPEMQYVIVHTGPTDEQGMNKEAGFINGGMFRRQESRKNPTLVINVGSIDETLGSIEAEGGTRLGDKLEVGQMGYAAYFIDSEGNLMGLWENRA